MSGKTSPVSTRSFYGESPPKRSRLHETNTIRPAFKSLKDNLIKFERKLSEPIKNAELKEIGEQEKGEEPREKSLDRDSPIPLKNLGNTCYENSIIQCLFNLNMFMDNFVSSMSRMRQFVIKSRINTFNVQDNPNPYDEIRSDIPSYFKPTNVEPYISNEASSDKSTITDTDVRYRIADAFDKLYKSYTQKRIQLEQFNQNSASTIPDTISTTTNITSLTNTIDAIDTTQFNKNHLEGSMNFCSDFAISRSNAAIPLCKSIQTGQFTTLSSCSNDNSETPNTNVTSVSSTASEAHTSNLTPIALVSPTTTSHEQSEIEIRLEDLKSAVGERSAQFNSTHQQDASEFFYHVIDSIQEFYQGLNKIQDEDNPVTKAFELELDYSIKCPKCHHRIMSPPEKIRTLPLALPNVNNHSETSINQENEANGAPTPPTSDLGLDSPKSNSSSEEHRYASDEKENQALADGIANKEENNSNNTMSTAKLELSGNDPYISPTPQQKKFTLRDALNNYFKDDLLDYNCSQKDCDSEQRTKKCYIRKLPQVLFITLARYSHTGKKNLDEVEAPFELSVPLRENRSPSQSPSAYRDDDDENNEYILVAVVCHLGSSLNAGHYTSYVYNQNNFSWYSCDDDSITKVQETEVKNDATKSGYCFFYAHKSCINERKQSQEEKTENFQQVELNQHRLDRSVVISNSVADSSVVMTPESSPKSSPPVSVIQIQESKMHEVHTCCANGTDEIDDWS